MVKYLVRSASNGQVRELLEIFDWDASFDAGLARPCSGAVTLNELGA